MESRTPSSGNYLWADEGVRLSNRQPELSAISRRRFRIAGSRHLRSGVYTQQH